MLPNIVCKLLKVHAVAFKKTKPPWDAFFCEITQLDNKEPREVVGSQVPLKKPSIAAEVEEYMVVQSREEEMSRIASIKLCLSDLKPCW